MVTKILIIILTNLAFLGLGGFLMYYGFQEGNIFVFLCGAGFAGTILFVDLIFFNNRKRAEAIAYHGKNGTAKILKITKIKSITDYRGRREDTGQVEVELEISIPNYPQYIAKTIMLSAFLSAEAGAIVNVSADPKDSSNVKII